MLCMAASLCPCSPSSLLPFSGLIFGRFDYPEEIKYFYIKWYYNKYCQMLSFSVVPQLRVEFKQSTCGWWNECAHPLWATCASSLHPVLRCVLKGGQHQEQKSWPKHSSQSRTSLFLVLLGEPLRDLGAWRCDLHQSLSQLPQRTASCSWGILQGWHQTALLPSSCASSTPCGTSASPCTPALSLLESRGWWPLWCSSVFLYSQRILSLAPGSLFASPVWSGH